MLLALEEQNAHWVEHLKEMFNQPAPAATFDFSAATYCIDQNVKMFEIVENETAISNSELKNNRAAGNYQIIAELLKHAGTSIPLSLTRLLNACQWEEGNTEE